MNLWSRLNLESQWARRPENAPERKLQQRKNAYLISCGPPEASGPLVTTLATPPPSTVLYSTY